MKARWLSILLMACPLSAQPQTEDADLVLESVEVSTTRLARPLQDTPSSVSQIDISVLADGQPNLQLDESLNRVPGLHTQNRYNFAQNLRLSSRGFGARAPFGVRGLRIIVDGIPETLPDGQSQLDSIDLDSARRITVIRGPASVLYGNASGAVIDIETADGRDQDLYASLRMEAGSHGLKRARTALGGQHQALNHHLSLSQLDYQGYREQSEVRKRQLNWRAGWQLDPARRIELVAGTMHTPYAQDPGGLTLAEAREDPRQAAGFANLLDSGQKVRQSRVGFFYRDLAFGGGELNARLFQTRRDFEQQLPFPGSSLIGFEREFIGAAADFQGLVRLGENFHRYLLGVETEQQRDHRQRFNSTNGNRTQNALQQADATALFLQTDSPLTDLLTLSLGIRLDSLRLRIDDRLGDDSGARRFNQTSYSLGLLYQTGIRASLYANTATAFESPTFTEFANPDGGSGFNPDIEPQLARNHELGIRGELGSALDYDLALFHIRVRDELLPFENNGRTFYENAGRTERSGLEAALAWRLSERITLTSAVTLADYRITRFRDRDGNDYTNNHIPGLPDGQLFAEIAWQNAVGYFMVLDAQYQGRVFAENSNETRVSGHTLINFRGGVRHEYGQHYVRLYGGVRNLGDSGYFANIRVNANPGQGLESRRYYEPGPRLHGYFGIELGF